MKVPNQKGMRTANLAALRESTATGLMAIIGLSVYRPDQHDMIRSWMSQILAWQFALIQ